MYTGDSCPADEIPVSQPRNDTFWIDCPKSEDGIPLYAEPDTYLSVALVFTSAVSQRLGLWLFDMVVTQLFQISIPQSKRNRAAAGQDSTCSIFSIIMYCFGLVWTENCDFGTAILISAGIISFWYFCYFVWAFKNRDTNLEDYAKESTKKSDISVTEKLEKTKL